MSIGCTVNSGYCGAPTSRKKRLPSGSLPNRTNRLFAIYSSRKFRPSVERRVYSRLQPYSTPIPSLFINQGHATCSCFSGKQAHYPQGLDCQEKGSSPENKYTHNPKNNTHNNNNDGEGQPGRASDVEEVASFSPTASCAVLSSHLIWRYTPQCRLLVVYTFDVGYQPGAHRSKINHTRAFPSLLLVS